MLMILFKLGIFEIDLTTIASFFIGIFLGAIITCSIYGLLVLGSLRNKKFLIKTEDDSLTASEVKDMIFEAQKSFKDKGLRGDNSRVNHCKDISMGLVYGIATRFFPKSKHPLLELSIDEAMMLTIYIENRVDEILNRKFLRLFKKIKISTIFEITQKTNQVMDSKAFKVGKEVNEKFNTFKKFINVVNPAWWLKKLVFDKTINVITDKICMVIIAVVGEETYKIYSKTVFNADVSIESNVDELVSSLDTELLDVSNEIKKSDEPIQATASKGSAIGKFKSKALLMDDNHKHCTELDLAFSFKNNETKEDYKAFSRFNGEEL